MNVVAAAPVVYCKKVLETSKTVILRCLDFGVRLKHFVLLSFELVSLEIFQARAVLINAGQANAATVRYLSFSLMLEISRDLKLCCLGVNSYGSEIA